MRWLLIPTDPHLRVTAGCPGARHVPWDLREVLIFGMDLASQPQPSFHAEPMAVCIVGSLGCRNFLQLQRTQSHSQRLFQMLAQTTALMQMMMERCEVQVRFDKLSLADGMM